MFSIYDGRDKFYQWDKDRKLVVDDDTITQVHFANCLCSNARVCEVYFHDDDFGGIRLVNVPDELLTEYMDIRVWGYDGEMTKYEEIFEIEKRTKPADYIYTPEEKKTWEELDERVEAVEKDVDYLERLRIGRVGKGYKAESFNTTDEAYGSYSHTEGKASSTYGVGAHAEGTDTPDDDATVITETVEFINPYTQEQMKVSFSGPRATGTGSHAEGSNTLAFGHSSHAEGCQTQAIGGRSHAEGSGTKAMGHRAHAEGAYTEASGRSAHAEGEYTNASGHQSHAEGNETKASGSHSHAEGHKTEASGVSAHAEGQETLAEGGYAHAEGRKSQATGYDSHAEGYNTLASGHQSHAEGEGCKAILDRAHAEGCMTEANGYDSHSEGKGTVANGSQQHVQGRYNAIDNSNKYAHIVGNGTSGSDRKNIHTLDWNGNAWFAGGVTCKDGIFLIIGNRRYHITIENGQVIAVDLGTI